MKFCKDCEYFHGGDFQLFDGGMVKTFARMACLVNKKETFEPVMGEQSYVGVESAHEMRKPRAACGVGAKLFKLKIIEPQNVPVWSVNGWNHS